jgi:hypothetical protein
VGSEVKGGEGIVVFLKVLSTPIQEELSPEKGIM